MIAWVLAVALAVPIPKDVQAACDEAVLAKDQPALQTCVETWVLGDPENPLTDYYGFHLAVLREDVTAAVAARKRALLRGLDGPQAREIKVMDLPDNPWLSVQRTLIGVVLSLAMVGMVWARIRAMRETASGESGG